MPSGETRLPEAIFCLVGDVVNRRFDFLTRESDRLLASHFTSAFKGLQVDWMVHGGGEDYTGCAKHI